MSAEILRVHPDEPQPERIEYIVSCLRQGDVVALPTDTFYGLAVDPVNLHAVEQIYQIKSRQKHKPLSLLIASVAQAYELARDIDDRFDRLAERFWPGPLTIIVRAEASCRCARRRIRATWRCAFRMRRLRAQWWSALGCRSRRRRRTWRVQRVRSRGVRSRPDRRSHSADRRWRAVGACGADDDCRSLRQQRTLADPTRRSHLDA